MSIKEKGSAAGLTKEQIAAESNPKPQEEQKNTPQKKPEPRFWAEVQQRTVSLFASAALAPMLLEPRVLIESQANSDTSSPPHFSIKANAKLAFSTESGPRGALVIEPNQTRKIFVWSGELDRPSINGPSTLAVHTGAEAPGNGYERGPAMPGSYKITLFSFLDGEPLPSVQVVLPPSNDHSLRAQDATDDHSFVKAFLQEAKELPEEAFWIRPGRYDEKEIAEMAYLVEQTQIPALHRELLQRCKRLQLLEHDLVTPPILADDLEEVRVHARDRDLFPWFALKPYDSGDFICFDLENGGLVRARQLQIEPIAESPRQYLLKLLQLAKEEFLK
jgi:hypothetical protein